MKKFLKSKKQKKPPVVVQEQEPLQTKNVRELRQQVDEVADLMETNIERMIQRQAQLDNLETRSDVLEANANQFHRVTQRTRRAMCFKSCKRSVCIGVTVAASVLIIVGVIVVVAVIKTKIASGH